jgi:predicted Zn finger-like uncharacterized protein
MLTTCPECHTCFRVSQSQLDQRRGLVRCGRCSAVFNAYDTLLPELATPLRQEAAPPPAATTQPAIPLADAAPAEERPAPSWGGAGTTETLPSDGDGLLAAGLHTRPEATRVAPETAASVSAAAEAPSGAASPSETSDAILLSALPSARKRALPNWRSAMWMLASLLLTATFLLQTTYFLRAEIAAGWPETRPLLEDACLRLGCSVPLPRDPLALRIDASSLESVPEDASHAILRVSLSNRSDRVIAWPHLILILTDVRDLPVAQRPFPPADYLKDAGLEAQGMAPGEEREIRLDLELKGLTAYGYKLDKQYP